MPRPTGSTRKRRSFRTEAIRKQPLGRTKNCSKSFPKTRFPQKKEQLDAKHDERAHRINVTLNIKRDTAPTYEFPGYDRWFNKKNKRALRFHTELTDARSIWRCCIQKGSFLFGYRYPIRGYTFSLDGIEDWLSGKDQVRDYWPHPMSARAASEIAQAAIAHYAREYQDFLSGQDTS